MLWQKTAGSVIGGQLLQYGLKECVVQPSTEHAILPVRPIKGVNTDTPCLCYSQFHSVCDVVYFKVNDRSFFISIVPVSGKISIILTWRYDLKMNIKNESCIAILNEVNIHNIFLQYFKDC